MKHFFKDTDIRENILIALLITVTFFIFGSMEMYYTNVDEFFFQITEIIGWLFVFCIGSTILLLIVQSIFPKKIISKITSAILFAIGVGLYLQGNCINANYGVLNGGEIEWQNYRIYGLCNTGIWIGIIAISIILSIKLKKDIVQKIHCYLSGSIIAIELFTLMVLSVTTPNKLDVLVTNNEQFTVGNKENIIIFLLDTFDTAVFDELLYSDQGEKIKDQFQDFTYYDNMAGGYPYTIYSIPLILSGKWYDRTTTTEEFLQNNSYTKSDLYPDLDQGGYSIGLYGDYHCFGNSIAQYTRNIHSGKEKVSSTSGVSFEFLQLTAFRYLPHELKKYTSYEFASFEKYHADDAYKMGNDIEFYEKLQNEKIKVEEGKAFVFYHLRGIHSPYSMDADVNAIENATEESQALGELKIVESYIDQLKENGIYENSTIIVMADHGYKGLGQNPIFLVKEATAQHEFTVNSAPVSFDDLRGTFSYWTIGDSKKQTTIYDFKEGEHRVRYFRWYVLADYNKLEIPFVEYAIYGDAGDVSSIQKTGNLYGSKGIYQQEKVKLKFDLNISFQEGGNYEDIINIGYRNWGGYIYSYGEYTSFILDTTEYEGGDLKLDISVANVLASFQTLQLYVNDNYLDESVAYVGGDILTYVIPKDYLSQDTTEIRLVYPNMIKEGVNTIEGHSDEGMAIVYDYISLSQLDELESGKTYEFGTGGNANRIIRDGLSAAETDFRWSCGTESNFIWTVNEKKDLKLSVKLKSIVNDRQNLEIYMNDHFLQEVIANDLEFVINIPAETLKNGINNLKIMYPNAISPKELNGSEDNRLLSVAFEKIVIR